MGWDKLRVRERKQSGRRGSSIFVRPCLCILALFWFGLVMSHNMTTGCWVGVDWVSCNAKVVQSPSLKAIFLLDGQH